jgi:N utilization substance protein A
MSFDLNAIIGQMGRDKGINKKVLIDAVESAMLSAAKKHYGHNLNLETKFNEETGEIEVHQFKVVVDKVDDPDTQIGMTEARKNFDPDAMVGDEFGEKLDTHMLGRIAAQTAKQVIIQKVRDAERGVIFEEYKGSKGELINGIVQRYDRGNVIVNLGRTEAILPRREQIIREKYRQGDRVRSMILDIDPSARGPQIILSRSHPEFLKKIFALEVPEINEGTIEIKAVAREPGERAKIAVHSTDSSVDPVGACVGIKGSRVQAVVQELKGERIDIVTWTPDEPSFVARALSPAEVTRVVVDEDKHAMEVIVADDQLSLAIGRRGQNVKLASKLTGWKIDVRSVSVAEEEAKRARAALSTIPGLEFTRVELMFQEGFRSVRDVMNANIDDLLEVEGMTEQEAKDIVQRAHVLYEQMKADGLVSEDDENDSTPSDLDKLLISNELKERVKGSGYNNIQALASASFDELGTKGFSEEDVQSIRDALDIFFRGGVIRPSM